MMNDREARRIRMQDLIRLNRERRKREQPEDGWFQEIVEQLGEGTVILSEWKSKEIMHRMVSDFTVAEWGRLAWSRIPNHREAEEIGEITEFLSKRVNVDVQEVYVLWGYGSAPCLRVSLRKALEHWEELRDYGGDAFLYAPDGTFVVELYHEGDIVVGWRE
jgi:hypothetical protein